MVDTHHYTFVQIHRRYNSKSEPSCNLWTLGNNDVSMQVYYNRLLWCGMLVMGEVVCVGEGQGTVSI